MFYCVECKEIVNNDEMNIFSYKDCYNNCLDVCYVCYNNINNKLKQENHIDYFKL